MDNKSQYESQLDKNSTINNQLLIDFSAWLKTKNLNDNTIEKHVNNMNFYLNEFLIFNEIVPFDDGIYKIDEFLGDWFIKKVHWSNLASVKSFIATFKKFFSFLLNLNKIDKSAYSNLNSIIKLNSEKWQKTFLKYTNPEIKDAKDCWE